MTHLPFGLLAPLLLSLPALAQTRFRDSGQTIGILKPGPLNLNRRRRVTNPWYGRFGVANSEQRGLSPSVLICWPGLRYLPTQPPNRPHDATLYRFPSFFGSFSGFAAGDSRRGMVVRQSSDWVSSPVPSRLRAGLGFRLGTTWA
jgi:hypothetical protein